MRDKEIISFLITEDEKKMMQDIMRTWNIEEKDVLSSSLYFICGFKELLKLGKRT